MSNLKLNLVLLPLWLNVFILIVTSHPLMLPSAFFNQFEKLSENNNPTVPYKVDYHIGSRFDPFKEPLNSPDDYDGTGIRPAMRAPTVDVLLPWEDDPEIVYLTEKPQNITNNVTSVSSSTSSTLSSSSSSLPDQSSTLSSSTKSSSINPVTESNTTVSLLPWEEDSWQLFETSVSSSSPNFTFITAPSTFKTPLYVSITTSSTSPSTTSGPTSSTSTSTVSSSTVTAGISTTYSPLPWEEDYFDNIVSNPIQVGSTLKPYEPPTTKLTTSSQEIGTTTTTRSTDLLITISTNPESSVEESIFNLVPLKPIDNSDPNWPKFPNKRPKSNKIGYN
ncbi:A-agglutinin anchorage subunit-like [Tetranychus urticae]|uniref:Uncharacterized protein n=1 Tax=Tetranychus urticae TaxID=32264 RepID=T1KFR5_TETUR|nr:A-agglutinin anchorage subunit-like [Tetranychus urticae]